MEKVVRFLKFMWLVIAIVSFCIATYHLIFTALTDALFFYFFAGMATGGSNVKFLALSDARDYKSVIVLEPPLHTENIRLGTVIQQVAPDRFLHPVHVMRLYLDGLPDRTVTQESVRVGRVRSVDSTDANFPEIDAPSSSLAKNFIQAPEGAGPTF